MTGLGIDTQVPKLPVTIVIPTWRRPEWLERCLIAVNAQQPGPSAVVVVGRADDRPTLEIARRYGVQWAVVSEAGHVEPIRVALNVVNTPLLAMIDDDAEPIETTWLDNLVRVFDDPRVGCVGSQVRNVGLWPRKVRRSSGRIRWYGRVIGNAAGRVDSEPVQIAAPQEANWAWRTEVLAAVTIDPLWDQGDAVMYSLDLCLQAKRAGWLVLFTSDAPVLHHLATRDQSLPRADAAERTFATVRNLTYIALKHYRWRLVPFALWSTLIGDRTIYGLASAAIDLTTRPGAAPKIAASARGRAAAVHEWNEYRRLRAATTKNG